MMNRKKCRLSRTQGYIIHHRVGSNRPAQDQTGPAQDQTRPAQDQTRPVQDQTRPAQDQTRPVQDHKKLAHGYGL